MNKHPTRRLTMALLLVLLVWLPGRVAMADMLPQLHPAPGDVANFDAAMEQGRAAAKAQQWGQARASFLQAWRIAPDRPDVLFLLGVVESHLPGHQWQAIDWWRAFLALRKDRKSAAYSLAKKQIVAAEGAAHQQALALLQQLRKLSGMLPLASDQAAARAKIRADADYVQMLQHWRKTAHGQQTMGLAGAWCWGLTAVNAHVPPDAMLAVALRPGTVKQPGLSWQVFNRQQQVFTRWIKHVGRAERLIGEPRVHHRFAMYWALRFYLQHAQAELHAGHDRRLWAVAQNILALQPTAYEMTRAVQPRNEYANGLYQQILPANAWGRQAMAALYLPMNVGISFTERYNRRARLKVLTGHWNLAVRDYRKILGIYAALANPNFPYDVATAQRLMRCQSYEYVRLGRALFHLGRYRQAGTAYAQARITFPKNSAAVRGLQRVQHRLGELAVLAELTRKIQHGQKSAEVLAGLAQLRFHLGDIAGALADCRSAIIRDGNLCLPRMIRMKIEMQQGQYLEAIADGSGLLALHCAHPTAMYLLRARCRRHAGQWPQAMADYQQVLRVDGKNILALAGRMRCDVRLHRYHDVALDAVAVILAHAPAAAYAEAVAALKTAARGGSKIAMVYLGRLYAWGKVTRPNYLPVWSAPLGGPPPTRPGGVPIDRGIAIQAFQKAAAEGSGAAMAAMGALGYEDTLPGLYKYHVAMSWFRKAAKVGYGDAMAAIGWLYADGSGVARNDATALKWFRRAAAAGSGRGMDAIGLFYQKGRGGVAANLPKALAWYRRAAHAGCGGALNNIGYFYDNGLGVAKNPKEAVRWYRRAAAAGNQAGLYDLMTCYRDGDGVAKNALKARKYQALLGSQNYVDVCYKLGLHYWRMGAKGDELAIHWFGKGAGLGDRRAMRRLGDVYFGRKAPDASKALRWYRRAAHLGSAKAMSVLAMAYYRATGVPLDYSQAQTWWLRAAAHGDVSAQRWLGIMFAAGRGIPFHFAPDYVRAKRCWELAAKEGSNNARYDLYLLYHNGWGGMYNTFMAAKWLAKTGDASAVYKLAMRYEDGRGTATNLVKAVALLKQASERRWPAAMDELAVDYLVGSGIKRDNAEALKWFHEAAKYGSVQAMYSLGRIYRQGKIVARDYVKAMAWYKKAAQSGLAAAYGDMGVMYAWGVGVPEDRSVAARLFKTGAIKGSKLCMRWLAYYYKQGFGVAKDQVKATLWWARSGDRFSENQMGFDYYAGKGVARNYKLAVHWFKKAAGSGDSTAMDNLGYCYLHGYGVAAWNYRAMYWFHSAADKGNVHAMVSLGDRYCYGQIDGIKLAYYHLDISKGILWYRKAAAEGSVAAAVDLGAMCMKGKLVMEDDQGAVGWFRKAAAEGSANAMNWLAWCYQNGRGVPQDHAKAMEWQRKAQAAAAK